MDERMMQGMDKETEKVEVDQGLPLCHRPFPG